MVHPHLAGLRGHLLVLRRVLLRDGNQESIDVGHGLSPRSRSPNCSSASRAYNALSRNSSSCRPMPTMRPRSIDHDAVGIDGGGQPVRDDQRGAVAHEPLQRVLHQPLALRIERAGGLVQQQDGRVLEDGARDGDALLLPARQPRAAFAEEGVVAFRQPADEFVGRRGARRGLDLRVAGAGPPITDVLARAGAEDHGFLRHEADVRAHRGRIGAARCRRRR